MRVTIILPDITRPAGVSLFLPPALAALERGGVARADVTCLFATGTHRGHTPAEWREIVGDEVMKSGVRLADHHCDTSPMAPIHLESRPAPLLLNRLAVACDLLIITGAIGYHYLAGFSGGGKALLPGVASREEAIAFHALTLDPEKNRRHPGVGAGLVAGNPLQEAIDQLLKGIGNAFLINTITGADGSAVDLVTGDPEAASLEGRRRAARLADVPLAGPADLVIASCGGFPKDINMIQAQKSYDNACRALADGGKLYLAAQCRDGFGSDSFHTWFRHGSPEKMAEALRRDFVINGQTAMAVKEKSGHYPTTLLSDLPRDEVMAMGMRPLGREAFIKEAAEEFERASSCVIMPEAGFIMPRLESKERMQDRI